MRKKLVDLPPGSRFRIMLNGRNGKRELEKKNDTDTITSARCDGVTYMVNKNLKVEVVNNG